MFNMASKYQIGRGFDHTPRKQLRLEYRD